MDRDPSPALDPASVAQPAPPTGARPLAVILRETFGFDAFRPYQRAVCEAAVAGHDVLLVMPTGAGKSLCYQLPGIARGGTTLVVSPLIALMEDQVAKLLEKGVRAARIHSGRERQESRQACVDYLAGRLDFLFIAPERLRVPGFPEMLAKRPLGLIAVDEAHCISHWGHDFRPDYRRLGEWLPKLRPAPIVAATATATPRVQADIVEQLGMREARPFIHGFRRHNIGVEVAELPPRMRADAAEALLQEPGRTPAIIYAPTRKETESLAAKLGKQMRAAAYHAGMNAQTREVAQEGFLSGELDVIVATIAFGMGIDKADVRTVVHTALPGSVEGYYQEIGRAGRDGQPSRAVLMHSYADRRTHDFFHGQSYPEPAMLAKVYRALQPSPQSLEGLREKVGLESDVFDVVVEKLWLHGGAQVDAEGNIARAGGDWRKPYDAQRQHKRQQLDHMLRLAEHDACRMLQLVRHFGDAEDDGTPCGVCDVCAPAERLVDNTRAVAEDDMRLMRTILVQLLGAGGTTGQVYKALNDPKLHRSHFEAILDALASAGMVQLRQDEFDKDGETIRFRRAKLTQLGERAAAGGVALDGARVAQTSAPGKKRGAAKAPGSGRASGAGKASGADASSSQAKPAPEPEVLDAPPELVEALVGWRLKEARRSGGPAFRVLTNRVLSTIAARQPLSEDELLAVPGMGARLVRRHGAEILAIVRAWVGR